MLFEHEAQLVDNSRAPGSYVPKQKTPEKGNLIRIIKPILQTLFNLRLHGAINAIGQSHGARRVLLLHSTKD